MLRNAGPGSTRIILNRSSTASSTSTISPSCSATNNPAGNTVLKLSPASCFLSLEDQRKSYLEPPSYKMSSTPFPPSSLPFWCTCPSMPHTAQNMARRSLSGSIVFAVTPGRVRGPVLAYAIEYFQTHQSAPAAKWLETDSELTSLHFAFAHQPQPSSCPASPKKSTGNNTDPSQYRCKNFNRPGGCKYSHFHTG